jgi:spermidine/putrescine-binding protein
MTTIKKIFFAVIGITLFFMTIQTFYCPSTIYIYDWYGMLDLELIKEFEKETGLRVVYDVYSDNETLEARLLTGKSGYDIVFPSLIPFAVFQSDIGLYEPIDRTKINTHCIHPHFLDILKTYSNFLIPYYYGTIGLLYHKKKLKHLLKDDFEIHAHSLDLIFNVDILKKIHTGGISFLEESVDVLPILKMYLHNDNDTFVKERLKNIRPFIRKFTSSHFIQDLVKGDLVLAMSWSGEARRATEEDPNLVYVVPKEGTLLWVDCIAIPKGAQLDKAYQFINFLLKETTATRITKNTFVPTTITASYKNLENLQVILDDDILKKLNLNKIETPEESMYNNRLWMVFRNHTL